MISTEALRGKAYLREVYSDPVQRKELDEKIKIYFKECAAFDGLRSLGNSSPHIGYSYVRHKAFISKDEVVSGDWNAYERDFVLHNVRKLVQEIFPNKQDKLDVYEYIALHQGNKGNANSFARTRANIDEFLEKIRSGTFKTIAEKENESLPSYKAEVLRKEIEDLKAKQPAVYDPSAEILVCFDVFEDLKVKKFSPNGQLIVLELFKALDGLEEACLKGKLAEFDRACLDNPQFVNVLQDEQSKNLEKIKQMLNKFEFEVKAKEMFKENLRAKKDELFDLVGEASDSEESELLDDEEKTDVKEIKKDELKIKTVKMTIDYSDDSDLETSNDSDSIPAKKPSWCAQAYKKFLQLISFIWKKLY